MGIDEAFFSMVTGFSRLAVLENKLEEITVLMASFFEAMLFVKPAFVLKVIPLYVISKNQYSIDIPANQTILNDLFKGSRVTILNPANLYKPGSLVFILITLTSFI